AYILRYTPRGRSRRSFAPLREGTWRPRTSESRNGRTAAPPGRVARPYHGISGVYPCLATAAGDRAGFGRDAAPGVAANGWRGGRQGDVAGRRRERPSPQRGAAWRTMSPSLR